MGLLLIIFLVFVVSVGLLFFAIGGFVESLGEKPCVECAETILKDARKCKHCGAAQPEALKAVAAAPAAPAMQPVDSVTASDIQRLTDKAARLKDSPDFIALQTRLRTEAASSERKRFWWALIVAGFFTVSAWGGGAQPGEVIARGVLAGVVAVIAYLVLGAISRRKINEKYRVGVEGLPEPAPAMERETA